MTSGTTTQTPSLYDSCTPRADIIKGTFNPELFTASLNQVMDSYAGQKVAETPYTDASVFFGEATYPTSGMRDLLSTVLLRVSGDTTASAITRLETGFGGGKTHSLIGLVHCAKRGTDIKDLVDPLFPDLPLPAPGAVDIVAIAGDVLSVNKPSGAALIPHTLWGELAMQLGGEALYRDLEGDVTSVAAPGKDFFKRVFEDRKVVILIDELAQYVARFEAAHPGKGATQVAAFLMSLSTFARSASGIAVVISLASSTDAFARQSESLGSELTRITGSEVAPEEAAKRAALAVGETESVVARDALPIKPVPQNELARVLARRLFSRIDPDAARMVAETYATLYASSPVDLPSEAKQTDYVDQLQRSYPFHPTFLRFLNEKLASIETFQGTRGVLRVMTLAIRLLWKKRPYAPMIHVGHLDFSDRLMTDEIVGSRLKAGDMQIVLNTDVGGPQSDTLASNRSRAQMRDATNPLPSEVPYHEMTWRVVLVNSLVGRAGGVASNLFGVNESDASRQTRWHFSRGAIVGTFGRHDFSLKWTYAEMPYAGPSSGIRWALSQVLDAYKGIVELALPVHKAQNENLPLRIINGSAGNMSQVATGTVDLVCFDPPYYDNVQYGELSDFYYVWQKRGLRDVFPGLFSRRHVNKTDEAVANPSRDGSASNAKAAYERLMSEIFAECRRVLSDDGVMTLMFTHKKQEAWETLTRSLIESGWVITACMPVESESGYSTHQMNMASAASTIFITCRKRVDEGAEPAAWQGIGGTGVAARIRTAVQDGLVEFERLNLSPVDEMIASFGRALQVLSERWPVYDGDEVVSPVQAMTAASAVVAAHQITRITEGRLSIEDLDTETGIALTVLGAFGTAEFAFDDARNLANALNVAIEGKNGNYTVSDRKVGLATQQAGATYAAPLVKSGSKVRLAAPEERAAARLEKPQTAWDRLHGLITAYREGEDVLARAYFEKHCLDQAQLLMDLLEVYRAEIADEQLQREVDWVRFALESFGGAR